MNVTVVRVHTVLWHVWYQRNARSYNLSTTVHSTCNETISLFLSDFHEPLKSKATELVGFIYSPINRFVGRQWERSLKDLRILASPLAPAEVSARAGHYESLLKCRFANIWGLQEMCLWQRSKLKQNKWQRLTHFSCWTCTYLLFKVQAHFPPFIPLSKNFNSLPSSFKKKILQNHSENYFSFWEKRLRQCFSWFLFSLGEIRSNTKRHKATLSRSEVGSV